MTDTSTRIQTPGPEQQVVSWLNATLGEYGYHDLEASDDLVQRIDWSKLVDYDFHPALFLTDFCRHFRIRHDHPHWKPYPGEGTGFWRWIDHFGQGGPDDQFFLGLDYPPLPVPLLIEIVRSGEWIYPVHWGERDRAPSERTDN